MHPSLPALCVLALLPALPARAEMFRDWGVDRDNSDRVFLKSCSGAMEPAPFGGGAFSPCIDVTCDPETGFFLTVAVPNDGSQTDLRATVYAEGRDKGRFSFSLRPETPGFHSAQLTAEEVRPLLEDLAKSLTMTVLFEKPPMKDLQTLRGYPMDGAAEAIPEFLASCLLLNGAAVAPEPSLPSFATDDTPAKPAAPDPAAEAPPLPSFTDEAAPTEQGPAPSAPVAELTATADPTQAPPGVTPGMPLTFVPDAGAAPATPAEDPSRFVAIRWPQSPTRRPRR